MTNTTISAPGHDLRTAREGAGLTRAELAALADCSLASLGNIEAGAVPKRSAVLDAAWAALARISDNAAPAGGEVEDRREDRRHDTG